MTLKYPLELNEGQVDYVSFTHHKYQSNKVGATAPAEGSPIILYMPASTPAMNQGNNWGAEKFEGPLGAFKRDVGMAGANIIDGADLSSAEKGKATGKNVINQLKSVVAGTDAGGAAKQLGVGMVAGFAGVNANQLMALSKGQIFNPNVELLYDGPKVRSFSMSFTMVPKSSDESKRINEIVKEFKVWSAPKENGGMYEVPHIWQVQYMLANKQNPNMNVFKRAALTDVAIQNNQGLNMHMSFDDGMPIITSLALTFTEVDVITRDDHLDASNNVGY